MKPLLFIPETQTPKDVDGAIAEYGIGDIFPWANLSTAPCTGPEGLRGTMNGYERALYRPEEQVWVSCSGGSYWIGIWDSERPAPSELRRETFLAGHGVRLGDGNEWTVPVARRFSGGTLLEQRMTLDDGGDPLLEVVDSQRHLYDVACGVYDSLTDVGTFSMDDREVIEIAVEALGVNYRVNGVLAANVLGLFTTSNLSEILYALVDWPTLTKMMEVLNAEQLPGGDGKKNGEARDSSSGGTGGVVGSVDTPRASRISS